MTFKWFHTIENGECQQILDSGIISSVTRYEAISLLQKSKPKIFYIGHVVLEELKNKGSQCHGMASES